MYALLTSLAFMGVGAEPVPIITTDISRDVEVAANDIVKVPVHDRKFYRYLSYYAVPVEARKEFALADKFAQNQISTKTRFGNATHVGGTCYRVDLRNYGWQGAVWEKLADSEPYYHDFKVVIEEKVSWKTGTRTEEVRQGRQNRYGEWYDIRTVKKEVPYKEKVVEKVKKAKVVRADWLVEPHISVLEKETGSFVPIVRADWFLWQTGGQDRRNGAGYYDFLNIKSQADLEKLVGIDRKVVETIGKEVAGIARKSGVALQPRQLWRLQGHSGSWWESRDVFRRNNRVEDRDRNAITQLDKDFKPDALEVFATLPNDLWVLAALDNKGNLQATVPDNIAADHFASSNDRRIQPGASCLRCHTTGLQPIDDFARKFYKGANLLTSKNKDLQIRLESVYLGPLKQKMQIDLLIYDTALQRLNGWKAADVSKIYTKFYYGYEEADLTAEDCARELGVSKECLLQAIAKSGGYGNNVLLSLLNQPPIPVLRQHFEDNFGVFMKALGFCK